MNGPTTISKVIAFELGLLIAVLVWIAFAGIPGVKTHPVAETEEQTDGSFANVSPVYEPMRSDQSTQAYSATRSHRRAPVDYRADDIQAAQAPAQIPVAKVQTYDPGLTGGVYDDQVDATGQLTYGVDEPTGNVEGYVVNQDPANYIGTFPEPVLDSPYDYYYGRPYGYTQPVEIVVLNNNHAFSRRSVGNHCNFVRRTPNRGPQLRPGPQRGPIAPRPAPVAVGRNVQPRPRVNAGNNNVAPRRIASAQNVRPAGPSRQPSRNP